jgi:hypothetical protein
MLDQELLKLSKKYKRQADNLLQKTQLLKFLQKYGQIQIIGSYAYDLMLSGDIDIHIVNPKFTKKKVIKILNELLNQKQFYAQLFYDFIRRRRPGFPRGYYIGLKTLFGGNKWKIDLWFINKPSKKAFIPSAKQINQHRLTILKLKQQALNNNLKIHSTAIYKAVIQQGIKDIKYFQK